MVPASTLKLPDVPLMAFLINVTCLLHLEKAVKSGYPRASRWPLKKWSDKNKLKWLFLHQNLPAVAKEFLQVNFQIRLSCIAFQHTGWRVCSGTRFLVIFQISGALGAKLFFYEMKPIYHTTIFKKNFWNTCKIIARTSTFNHLKNCQKRRISPHVK